MTLESEIQVLILELPYTKAETGNTSFPHCEEDNNNTDIKQVLWIASLYIVISTHNNEEQSVSLFYLVEPYCQH